MDKGIEFEAAERSGLMPPSMQRSQGQLATVYAPGAFFTFEGGLGACQTKVDQGNSVGHPDLTESVINQIVIRFHEALRTWFERANITGGDTSVPPELRIDGAVLREGQLHLPPTGNLIFQLPRHVGYEPLPLSFVCNRCHRFEFFEDLSAYDRHHYRLDGGCSARDGHPCQWRQLDVVFVSQSGEFCPPMPGRYAWITGSKETPGKCIFFHARCEVCGSRKVRLNTDNSQIGRWYFYCGNGTCPGRAFGDKQWLQNDPFLTEFYGDNFPEHVRECRMRPISYRASSAYYPQSERFVLVPESQGELQGLLNTDNPARLTQFLAERFKFPGRSYTDEQIKDLLEQAGKANEWAEYKSMQDLVESLKKMPVDQVQIDTASKIANDKRAKWSQGDPPLIRQNYELPQNISERLAWRDRFTNRFDPFVLTVEHEALRRGKLQTSGGSGRQPFVRFGHMDNDLAPKDPEAKRTQEEFTRVQMRVMGIEDLGLIREFDLCLFTFGYTRVGAQPTVGISNQTFPTRLRLFDNVNTARGPKRPLYVIRQANEAFYFQLQPAVVYQWLNDLGVVDLPKWDPNGAEDFGGKVLECAMPFGRYFSELSPGPASAYRYIYMLLHTFSHVVMKGIAEHSGLDLSSVSEYIFPADLAFVVYRNGTTMDLGNLSALWRNTNNVFLKDLLDPKMNRCNSGQLCPGACPDCIVIPETSCIAANNLLSRSVLIGGLAPKLDTTHNGQRIPGFFDTANGLTPNA